MIIMTEIKKALTTCKYILFAMQAVYTTAVSKHGTAKRLRCSMHGALVCAARTLEASGCVAAVLVTCMQAPCACLHAFCS
jgi:hypothetical protein